MECRVLVSAGYIYVVREERPGSQAGLAQAVTQSADPVVGPDWWWAGGGLSLDTTLHYYHHNTCVAQ